MKLKFDLKHTMSAHSRTRPEARNSLRATKGELREVQDDLRAT